MTAAVQVRERPILMSGSMVLATMRDVGPKANTRRVILPQPRNPETFGISPVWGWGVHRNGEHAGHFCLHAAFDVDGKRVDRFVRCPYGAPGERLYVRETWARENDIESEIAWLHYRATPHHGMRLPDRAHVTYLHESTTEAQVAAHVDAIRWKPSIHMPREASRLALEITGIRVERLQDISEDDALAEGVEPAFAPGVGPATARYAFRGLWHSLNSDRGYGWDVNPYVWVISFKRVAP